VRNTEFLADSKAPEIALFSPQTRLNHWAWPL
jgi:hypothetical protein